jgi:uncharacterized membrane protein
MEQDPHGHPHWSEQKTYQLFRWSIILKGAHAVFELIGGTIIFLLPIQPVVSFVSSFALDELAEDPNDFIATHLLAMADAYSVDVKLFAAWYLLSHGIVKVFLVAGLLREKSWAYPAALAVFGAFTAYQCYLLAFYTHSVALFLLTLFNLLIMYLIWHEWRIRLHYQRAHQSLPQG